MFNRNEPKLGCAFPTNWAVEHHMPAFQVPSLGLFVYRLLPFYVIYMIFWESAGRTHIDQLTWELGEHIRFLETYKQAKRFEEQMRMIGPPFFSAYVLTRDQGELYFESM
jgi:hypothetical protein